MFYGFTLNRTHARTYTRTHAHTHARTHTHTRTHAFLLTQGYEYCAKVARDNYAAHVAVASAAVGPCSAAGQYGSKCGLLVRMLTPPSLAAFLGTSMGGSAHGKGAIAELGEKHISTVPSSSSSTVSTPAVASSLSSFSSSSRPGSPGVRYV